MSDPRDFQPTDAPRRPEPTRSGPWRRLGIFVLRWPKAVVAVAVLVAISAAVLSAVKLRIRPGYVELLSPRSASQARYLDLLREFGNVESLYVVVQSDDEAAAAAMVDRLGPDIAALRETDGSPRASGVLWRVDRRWFFDRLPAYLPAEALTAIVARAADPSFGPLVRNPDPAATLAAIGSAFDAGERAPQAGEAAAELAGAAPAAATGLHAMSALVAEMAAAARGGEASLEHALAALSPAGTADNLDAEGRLQLGPGVFLVTVRPSNVTNDADVMAGLIDGVRGAARAIQRDLPSRVEVRLTGAPALLVDEMKAAHRDTAWTTVVSFALVCLLFVVSFATLRHVFHACLTLAAGLALTFGAAWIMVGYLNLFSAVFGAILVGVGIDYGILVITHYEALRRARATPHDALLDTFEVVGPATAILVLANAAAFLSIMLAEFRGFSQLGLISAVGLVLCLVMTHTMLPALLLLSARRQASKEGPDRTYHRGARPWSWAIVQFPLRHPLGVAIGGAVIVLACLARIPSLSFDYNLLNLQPRGTDAAALAEGRGPARIATHLAEVMVDTLDEAASLESKLAALPSVASVHSAASVLPRDVDAKREALTTLAASLTPVAASGPALPAVDAAAVAAEAGRLEERAGSLQDLAFEGGRDDVVKGLDPLIAALADLGAACKEPAAAAGLTRFRDETAAQLARVVALLPDLAAGRGLSPADLPPALASALVGRTGKLAVIVEPRDAVWDRPALERFVGELRSVEPRITGPPVQILDVMDTMRRSCIQAGVVALVIILVIVGVSFRHPGGMLLSIGSLVVGFVIMMGAMAWLGLPLNPANLIALPIILGSGVDGGVPIVHRWLARRDATVAVTELGHAIILVSTSSLAGFASLAFANHRGVRSFGIATSIGTVAMLLTALWIMPAALVLFERSRARRAGRPPAMDAS